MRGFSSAEFANRAVIGKNGVTKTLQGLSGQENGEIGGEGGFGCGFFDRGKGIVEECWETESGE